MECSGLGIIYQERSVFKYTCVHVWYIYRNTTQAGPGIRFSYIQAFVPLVQLSMYRHPYHRSGYIRATLSHVQFYTGIHRSVYLQASLPQVQSIHRHAFQQVQLCTGIPVTGPVIYRHPFNKSGYIHASLRQVQSIHRHAFQQVQLCTGIPVTGPVIYRHPFNRSGYIHASLRQVQSIHRHAFQQVQLCTGIPVTGPVIYRHPFNRSSYILTCIPNTGPVIYMHPYHRSGYIQASLPRRVRICMHNVQFDPASRTVAVMAGSPGNRYINIQSPLTVSLRYKL
jgi:hypothetical protein